MIQAADVDPDNKLRLALLYALRYQKYAGNALTQVVDLLLNNGVAEGDVAVSGPLPAEASAEC